MPLTPEGKELLELAKENILANAEFYDQNVYAETKDEVCGTVCCVAGWVDFVKYGPEIHEEHASRRGYDYYDFWKAGEKLLGITDAEANELFAMVGDHDDVVFKTEYKKAKTPKARAKAAGRMIDRFMAKHS